MLVSACCQCRYFKVTWGLCPRDWEMKIYPECNSVVMEKVIGGQALSICNTDICVRVQVLTQYCCKGENTSCWAPGAGITDAHTSYTTRQCLLIKDYKWAAFQHAVSDQTLTCCSKPFSKLKECSVDQMELWKGRIDTSCEKQKNCCWDMWEKIHTHNM